MLLTLSSLSLLKKPVRSFMGRVKKPFTKTVVETVHVYHYTGKIITKCWHDSKYSTLTLECGKVIPRVITDMKCGDYYSYTEVKSN